MTLGLWAAKTGLDAQQTRMAVISNNLANVSTPGFKRSRVAFEDLLYQNVVQAGGATSTQTTAPSGLNLGTGVRVVSSQKIFTQGSLSQTGNGLNLSITGRGFFEIELPDGSRAYTRDGSFQRDQDGVIVTSTGFPLVPRISIDSNVQSVSIAADGTVSASISGQADTTNVGNIQLVDFINPSGLQPRGENLFLETAASGTPNTGTPGDSGLGSLNQGALEASNVNVVEELVNLIETQRAYEMNSKAIQTNDQMLQYVNNNL